MQSRGQGITVFLRGLAMGAADVVPGVSGGTIAFITGIYERLLDALKSCSPHALVLWRREGWRAFWRHIDGTFLLTLFGGVLTSIATLAHLIEYLLQAHPLLIWGFFFGLIGASSLYIGRQLPRSCWSVWLALVIGALVAVAIGEIKPVQLPINGLTVFASGSIAICAMILPGVSGSFLLLMMGMYPVFIEALTEANLGLLSVFAGGCVVGLLLFSHLLSWLLSRFHHHTLAVLTGFLVGSLTIVWPWKHALQTRVDRHGDTVPLVQENLWPWQYTSVTGEAAHTWLVIGCAVVGLVLVLGLEYAANGRPVSRD